MEDFCEMIEMIVKAITFYESLARTGPVEGFKIRGKEANSVLEYANGVFLPLDQGKVGAEGYRWIYYLTERVSFYSFLSL